jgi:glycosyltransferase involved in cell wall biosynthesis
MTSKFLNVCFVAPLPPNYGADGHSCGGIGHWTRMVYNYSQDRSDVSITVVDTTPRWRSINKFAIWQRALSGGAQFSSYILKLFVLLLTRRFDAIHLTTSGQLGIIRDLGVMYLAAAFKTPVVYHIRFGRVPELAKSKTREWKMMSRAIMKADVVIAIDQATRDSIVEYLPMANVLLIPNCINLSNISLPTISDKPCRTAFFAGWTVPTKGIEELIEAWSIIRPDGWELRIVGPGDAIYQQGLVEKYQPRGVSFFGEMPHGKTIELMAECDLFVFPSYTEGFPNAVLDKAVLATNVGAIPEMLDGGACGYLIHPQDMQSLKRALELLLNDNNLRIEFGARARKKVVEQYSIEAVFCKYMRAWHQAIAYD